MTPATTKRKRSYKQYQRPDNETPEERKEYMDAIMPLLPRERLELFGQAPALVQKMVARGLMKFPDPNNQERTE